jgi:hypothetical protein
MISSIKMLQSGSLHPTQCNLVLCRSYNLVVLGDSSVGRAQAAGIHGRDPFIVAIVAEILIAPFGTAKPLVGEGSPRVGPSRTGASLLLVLVLVVLVVVVGRGSRQSARMEEGLNG